MRLILAAVLMIAHSSPSLAGEGLYRVQRVLDGDTLEVCSLRRSCVTVRVNNLNTPEKRFCSPEASLKMLDCEPCQAGADLGVTATAYAQKLFTRHPRVRVRVLNKDRYGRTVGDVILWNGTSYADLMVKEGLASYYPCPNGRCKKRPRPWCPG